MRRAALLPTVLCAALATACATSRPTAGGAARLESTPGARPVAPVVLASRSLIPQATLNIDPTLTLYDVVGRYWPQVLRPPPSGTARPDPRGDVVGVFVNGSFTGGQDALRSIRASAVSSLQRLSRSEEFTKWGMSHPGGAILVTFR